MFTGGEGTSLKRPSGEHSSSAGGAVAEPDPATETGTQTTLTTDDTFEILRNQRRRYVLRFFLDRGADTVDLGTLAEHIAAAELETDVGRLTSAQRKRVYVSLYQCHLPKMDAAGVVDFDADRKTIEVCERATTLEPYLHLADDLSRRESTAGDQYLRAVAGGTALAVVGVYGPISGVVPTDVLALVLPTIVGALAVLQRGLDRN